MSGKNKCVLSEELKKSLIKEITPNLALLRTQARVSQDELSALIGVSRQTYSAIERKRRKMSWCTYLSLMFFYDHNQKTHQMLRKISVFPYELIRKFNEHIDDIDINIEELFGDEADSVLSKLDQQAMRSIKAMAMIEYARCTNLPSEAVIKSFSGLKFGSEDEDKEQDDNNVKAAKALKAIKKEKKAKQ